MRVHQGSDEHKLRAAHERRYENEQMLNVLFPRAYLLQISLPGGLLAETTNFRVFS